MRPYPFCRLAHRSFTSHVRRNSTKHSPQHQDIPSFLQYAESVSLSPNTTVYVGTLYEYTVLSALSSLNMTLHHCGGSGDRGVDLRGTWAIPGLTGESPDRSRIFPIVVQCKATKGGAGPHLIRELEGAIGPASRDTIGILATISHCTPGAKQQMLLSPRALAYCYIKQYAEGGHISQFVWNKPASVLLQGLGASIRYASVDGEGEGRIVLTLNGQVLSKLSQSRES